LSKTKGFFQQSSWRRDDIEKAPSRLPHCGRCGLASQCLSPRMAPTGGGKKKVLVVAEAPGTEEDRQGTQFIGQTGQVLRKLLHEIGEELEDSTKTNAIICRPPGNKIEDRYIEACRPNLLRTIEEVQPNVVILLGTSAAHSLIGTEWHRNIGNLGRWVGWRIPSALHQAWICPTYHPSYLDRTGMDAPLVRLTKAHLRSAFALHAKKPQVSRLEDLEQQVDRVTKPRLVRLRLRDLAKEKGILAFDYEATGLKPDNPKHRIVSCSFCLDGKNTWAGLIDEQCHRNLSRVLRARGLRKIASNLKFEERWTIAKLGHPVVGWHWDTMLAAHVLDNRPGITSLKFQAYVQLGIGDYESKVSGFLKSKTANGFNRIHEIDTESLLLYNGLDSLLEYMLADIQQTQMQQRAL